MRGFLKGFAVAAMIGAGGSAAQAETLTVYWNAGHAWDAYQAVIDKFEADNPGWTVQWEKFQWPDMRTKLIADFAVGNTPDLSAEPGGWVQEFAQQGLLKPLDEYVARDGEAMGYPGDWQDFSVNRNMVDGSYYGVQLHLTCATLVYNVDMLKEAGFDAPPKTWEEFRQIAIATTKPGRFGFAPNPVPAYYWPWMFQAGATYFDPEAKQVVFDSPEAAKGLQFIADLIHKDKAAPLPVTGADYEGPQKLFTAGRAAMIITGPWDVTPIRTGNPNLNWAIAPSLTDTAQATLAGGVSMMIPAAARHPDQAWDLLQRFVALETELAASVANGMTMPRKSWAASPEVQADPTLNSFGQCLPYARDITADLRLTGKSARVEELLKSAVDDVVYNNRPAAEVLAQYAAEANKALAE
ncbi:sugar ABC transporter substrate-binding protein [Devosia insulae DS-56]|uniref:Sugar ABC transporter substrate-binding protein n=1 Tax=Devosia insulae DS-56 TaxID=1116389 RepID=A0A1E5XTZ9_9HYPH|nr:sugar ABC transporter substrate-binding protein [Devosia insulae]OEO32052.1 sugar ABC transporter substrate-binding protein [Devosia insulae DS-56]